MALAGSGQGRRGWQQHNRLALTLPLVFDRRRVAGRFVQVLRFIGEPVRHESSLATPCDYCRRADTQLLGDFLDTQ